MTNPIRLSHHRHFTPDFFNDSDLTQRMIRYHECQAMLFKRIEKLPKRDKVIADLIYNHNVPRKIVAQEVGMTVSGITNNYRETARLNRDFRSRNPEATKEFMNSFGLPIFNEFIPIDTDLALFNISMNSDGGWSRPLPIRDGETILLPDGSVLLDSLYCYFHQVEMLAHVRKPNGQEVWYVNKHFYEKSLENPDWQSTMNGIYTSIFELKKKIKKK